jgi:hypothetical protein
MYYTIPHYAKCQKVERIWSRTKIELVVFLTLWALWLRGHESIGVNPISSDPHALPTVFVFLAHNYELLRV